MSFLKNIIKKIPAIHQMISDIDRLEKENQKLRDGYKFAPAGHFNSPIPDIDWVFENEEKIWGELPSELPGINLNPEAQLALVKKLKPFHDTNPFPKKKTEGFRYFFENPAYGYEDGIYLNAMIRHLEPTKIIEVGSGYSSCVILDTNERFFDNKIDCTFIEPYPEYFKSKLQPIDFQQNTIHESKLEDIPLDLFQSLGQNDILFIDSSHVSKIGSDVNYLIHQILPSLKKGVFIHIHDIGYPFQYPQKWIKEGRAWNENYILRAFLQFNSDFKITLFSSYLRKMHRPFMEENLPRIFEGGGGNIWLERVSV